MITIIAIGNSGYKIARNIIDAKLFDSVSLLVCGTDTANLSKHSECADGSLLLQAEEDLIQRNKVKIVETLNNINTAEVIITSSLNESIGQHFTYPIAYAASLLEKSVAIVSTMSFSHEDGRRIFNANKEVNWKFMEAFDFLLLQNNSTATLKTESEIGDANFPIVDTLRSILIRFDLSELLTYSPRMDAFFPQKCHDRLYCRLGGCSGLRRNIHDIRYRSRDNYWMLKDLIEQSGSSDNEVNDDIKAYIKNLKRLFLKYSIAKDVVKSKHGNNIPDQIRSDLNKIGKH